MTPRALAQFSVLLLLCQLVVAQVRAGALHPQKTLLALTRCLQHADANGYLQLFPDASSAHSIVTERFAPQGPPSDPLFSDTVAFSANYRAAQIGSFVSNHFYSNFIEADWRNLTILETRFDADTVITVAPTFWILDMPQTTHVAHLRARNVQAARDYTITILIRMLDGKWVSGIEVASFKEVLESGPVTEPIETPRATSGRIIYETPTGAKGYDYKFAGLRGRDSVWLLMQYRRHNEGDFELSKVSYHMSKNHRAEVEMSERDRMEPVVRRYHDATRGEDWWFVFNETLICYVISEDLQSVKAVLRLRKVR